MDSLEAACDARERVVGLGVWTLDGDVQCDACFSERLEERTTRFF